MDTSPMNSSIRILLTIASLSMIAGTAQAQNALGDGTALDANTGQYGNRNYTRPSFSAELSFRNSIATGNAPGGVSFRGDIGYRAPGEFSGSLGSDSLFSFRRDSLYSGLAGMGIRGTDALQYQFALTTGSTPPQNLVGNMSLARDGYYNPSQYRSGGTNGTSWGSNDASNSTIGYGQNANSTPDLRGNVLSSNTDPTSSITGFDSGSMHGVLRSSSTYVTTSTLQPSLLSVYTQGIEQQQVGLIASSLLGVTSTPLGQPEELNPLVARPGSTNPNSSNLDQSNPGAQPSSRLITSYDEMVMEMRERVEQLRTSRDIDTPSSMQVDETNDEWLLRQMQDLREKLYGTKPANDQVNPTNEDESDPVNIDQESEDTDQSPNQGIPGLIENDETGPLGQAIDARLNPDGEDRSIAQGLDSLESTTLDIDPDVLKVLRANANTVVEQFVVPNAESRDVYSEHMGAGQRLISDGRYFDAEERFTHALTIKPRDISAQLGRLHAQIGAGMVLSASVNLQTLYSTYPEVIASKYSGNLLPTKERIESLMIRLSERAGITGPELTYRSNEGAQVQVASAILLAYLSYQIDDQSSLAQAIEKINEIGSEPDRRLASLIDQLWMNPERPSTDSSAPKSDG